MQNYNKIKSNIDFESSFWKNKTILIDSRNLLFPKQSIFFALKGHLCDGHDFIDDLYNQGLRCFVISNYIEEKLYPSAEFVLVKDVITTLQNYAQHHRQKFKCPVIAIGGSNGKTIIKEWLYMLLQQDFDIVKSPKSYNSQIGVPLSVLNINSKHELAIFEAGISQPDEMQKLQKIIQPTIGIFTNIGKAHASGFKNQKQKIQEKLNLFKNCEVLIYKIDHKNIHNEIVKLNGPQLVSWGASKNSSIPIYTKIKKQHSLIRIEWKNEIKKLKIPFTNQAAIENCLHSVACLLYLGIKIKDIEKRLEKLRDVPMRLEIKEGINNCHILDDSYNNDLQGIQIALDFLNEKHKKTTGHKKTLILSDIPEANQSGNYPTIAQLILEHKIEKFIGIGPALNKNKSLFDAISETYFFETTNKLIQAIENTISFNQETILLKGARAFEFEKIAQRLKKRIHGSILEINLGAIKTNLKIYNNLLEPKTKIMVMVKASAYGSGAYEIAQLLQYHHVDYLGVAYVDEGVSLRKKGIYLPIMVMNTAEHEFDLICRYKLEPVIYSFSILNKFLLYLRKKISPNPYPIHLELDTGMHRLGFNTNEMNDLINTLLQSKEELRVTSIFSHLAASEELNHNKFSLDQISTFHQLSLQIEKALSYTSIKHILNSAGITRFSNRQFDMVRLGIGLYGIDPNKKLNNLENVLQLKTCISQIKILNQGQTVGYNRKGNIKKHSKIAILAIGYADGFYRAFSNGKISVKIHGQIAPTIGNICMDMCFVDVSHINEVKEGDEVIIFNSVEDINNMANAIDSIPYEILTNISERVPRIFYED
ncbi:MAG: bifunctional UDP-N-acetylmuramoyl-tripeptide:D-alanyl-D-alanine ligase/alanine racemase [Saprospiraceae bacterium]|nr:bifunctional UDP-N-acetylmuramoyl-tripeptide:D-alanyl-D-alanine ligase/alanine racemase [Saprospiraceae bacterium]